MISTMPQKSHLFLKLILIAAALYAYKNRSEIGHGLNNFLAKNSTVQEVKGSLKWAYEEFRPRTETEQAQQEAYAREQRKRAADLRAEGVNPYVEYVTPKDGKKWAEAKAGYAEIMKQFDR